MLFKTHPFTCLMQITLNVWFCYCISLGKLDYCCGWPINRHRIRWSFSLNRSSHMWELLLSADTPHKIFTSLWNANLSQTNNEFVIRQAQDSMKRGFQFITRNPPKMTGVHGKSVLQPQISHRLPRKLRSLIILRSPIKWRALNVVWVSQWG